MKRIFYLLLIVPALVWAESETNTHINQLETALIRVQQEAQSTYQQFLMIQELRRIEIQSAPFPALSNTPGQSVPAPIHDDIVQREQEKQKRIQQYTTDLDELYVYYKKLEDKRKMLGEEIDLLREIPYQEDSPVEP